MAHRARAQARQVPVTRRAHHGRGRLLRARSPRAGKRPRRATTSRPERLIRGDGEPSRRDRHSTLHVKGRGSGGYFLGGFVRWVAAPRARRACGPGEAHRPTSVDIVLEPSSGRSSAPSVRAARRGRDSSSIGMAGAQSGPRGRAQYLSRDPPLTGGAALGCSHRAARARQFRPAPRLRSANALAREG